MPTARPSPPPGLPAPAGLRVRTRLALASLSLVLASCASLPDAETGLALIEAGRPQEGLRALLDASRRAPTDARLRSQALLQLERYLAQRATEANAALARLDTGAVRRTVAEMQALAPADERARALAAEATALDSAAPALAQLRTALADDQLEAAQAALQGALSYAPPAVAVKELALRLEQAQQSRTAAARRATEAASPLARPVSLQVREASVRGTLETLARHTGLNLVLDNEVRRELRVTLSVQDAPLGDVLDLILLQAQLARRTLNAQTVYVYPATEARLREQQELDVRSFHVAHADVKQVAAALRTLLKLRDVVVDERGGTLLLREPPAVLEVAERIVRAHDRAEPEVMLELDVMEVSRERLSQLGLRLPDSIGLNVPGGSAPGGGSTLGELRGLSGDALQVSPLGIGVNLRLVDTDANLLASPRIRARHRQTARVMIGDKVPVITNTVTPLQSGSSVVTGAIQYLDVGIKLQVEPEVYPDGQVGIRLNLEVSNIAREIAGPSGSLAYQIGTRNAETVLRLKDGETQILAGLISDQSRQAASKLPGLGQLPLLGRLFSNVGGNDAKTEIVLSITPRIVRPVQALPAGLQQFASGTEAQVRPRAQTLESPRAVAPALQGEAAAGRTLTVVPTPAPPAAMPANGAPNGATNGAASAADAARAVPPGANALALPTATRRTRPAERADAPPSNTP